MNTTFFELVLPELTKDIDLLDLFRLMCQYKELTPIKYDDCEPLRNDFSEERIDEIAQVVSRGVDFLWKSHRKKTYGSLTLQQGKGKQTASFTLWTSVEKLDKPDDLTDFLTRTVIRFGATYGYIHYLSSQEVQALRGSETVSGNAANAPSLGVSRWKLVRYLPSIYWANIFGPEYVALFGGRDRVAAAPAPIVKELTPNTFYIQLSANMLDFAERHAEVIAIREELKAYLGTDCFFDPTKGVDGDYRVPDLGWEEPKKGSRLPATVLRALGRL